MVMTLQEMMKAVDRLSPEERAQLRVYIDQQKTPPMPVSTLSPEERIRRLDEAAKAIREGFTDAGWEAIERDMNAEYNGIP